MIWSPTISPRGVWCRFRRLCYRTYGYFLAYPKGTLSDSGCRAFRDWIIAESASVQDNAAFDNPVIAAAYSMRS